MLKVVFDGVHRSDISLGASERGMSKFVALIRDAGYEPSMISSDFAEELSFLPPRTVIWIHRPNIEFSEEDLDAISDFLFNGGSLLINSEWGNLDNSSENLNILLRRLGLLQYFRFDKLVDEYNPILTAANNNEKENLDFIEIKGFAQHPITEGLGKIGYYSGCSIESDWDNALAWSSAESFSDLNGNMELDGTEEFGEKVVAFFDTFENGRIIGIGDSSLIENQYFNDFDNSKFLVNCVLWLSRSL